MSCMAPHIKLFSGIETVQPKKNINASQSSIFDMTYVCMHKNIKRFEVPPFDSLLLSHFMLGQQDIQVIVSVCNKEAERLQLLVTTGGNISAALLLPHDHHKRRAAFVYSSEHN